MDANGAGTPYAGFVRIRPGEPIPPELKGGVVAIGNFDGIHRGHQAVLAETVAIAESTGRPALALTFEPHPRSYFQPGTPVFRLTPAALKADLIAACGLAGVVELAFTETFSKLTARGFVDKVLLESLEAAHVVTGFDFHFGKGREGGPAFLMQVGAEAGFSVGLIDAFRDENAAVVSSSRIRKALGEGDVAGAAALLGYRFAVEGTVIAGKKLGRTLGFPTANMSLPPEFGLRPGIYAVRFRRADGTLHDGVASFGHRPTVDEDGAALLETFLFDFSGDLYGETARVVFFGHLRDELRFEGLGPLVDQMNRDADEARALLAGVRPLGPLDALIGFR